MVYITKFRTNDLAPSSGKQIEFYKGTIDSFFKLTEDNCFVEFECRSLADDSYKKVVNVRLGRSKERGDYKIYPVEGEPNLKMEVFLQDLHLSSIANIDDYFAIRKKKDDRYILYYIPKDLLFSKFFPIVNGDLDLITDDNPPPTRPKVEGALQLITYGAPGTGKSYKIDKCTNESNSIRVTFHPDTDYATFVGAYKPTMDEQERYALDATGTTHKIEAKEKVIVYSFVPQAFMKAYVEAWRRWCDTSLDSDAKTYYLVIEEINRGNCAQIFGDLFQLLDRADNGFSAYAITPDDDIQKFLEKDKDYKLVDIPLTEDVKKTTEDGEKVIATAGDIKTGKKLVLPPNLCIWATMNTSDQSLFPIDSPFRRPWDWEYVPIEDAGKGWKIEVGGEKYEWWSFLEKINAVIATETSSEDKQLGYFFVKAKDKVIDAKTFVAKVIFYLWGDVFKDNLPDEDVFKYTFKKDGKDDKRHIRFADFYHPEAGSTKEQWRDKLLVSFLEALKVVKESPEDGTSGAPGPSGQNLVSAEGGSARDGE